jgi:RNA polymerase-interacting CarD/CdnL/TRCF family regulator
MKYLDQTYFSEAFTPEQRAELELLSANAERLSNADLVKLAAVMQELHDIDVQKQKEIEEQQNLEAHFARERAREIAAAARAADLEKQLKRARIAAALNIDPGEVNLE